MWFPEAVRKSILLQHPTFYFWYLIIINPRSFNDLVLREFPGASS